MTQEKKQYLFTVRVVDATKAQINKGVKKVQQTAKAVKGKAAEVVNATKTQVGKGLKKIQQTAEAVKGKIAEGVEDIEGRNERILEKLKASWEETASGLERGTVTIGINESMGSYATGSNNAYKMFSFGRQVGKSVSGEYPIIKK